MRVWNWLLKTKSRIFVGWAKRSVPTSSHRAVGTAQARLCPPYETAFEIRVTSLRGVKRRSNPESIIPGWSAGPDPESRDSGFDASHRPGMTGAGLLRGAGHRLHPRRTLPTLRRHQLHTAVERAPGLGGVGADRREQTDTGGAQPRLRDAIALHELLGDGLGAPARQIEIVVEGALAVGVADDEDVELRLARQQLGDLFQRRAAFGPDHRLVGVEVDAIERDVAGVDT